MKEKELCYICGAPDALSYYEGRSETIRIKGMERRVDNLSGWECEVCGDGFWDPDNDSADRYGEAKDELTLAARKMIGAEIKRTRRKLHLTQKEAVDLLSGAGHNAFSRYERGELLAPKPLVLLIRLLDRHPHLLAEARILAEGADLRGAFTYTVHDETETLKAS
ncbi:type II toxin-antitoxin system MqsA family antitoxin [Pseudomonas sp. MAFF 301449]|jgi:HTH-type transcriptional regulator/antitoxin MqsA|uniref:Type II toxin-antitoxin system MqsA family antitoxin n=1 Tax=Pseudomonas cyclaminis TaxID=2781239 RepID=A0ABR9STJ7_9PSED|nr:type II toxin-antitoxin system MqsA family antitoxin [Pseudomonas cyclaminis]MBE8592132.1 type II toxin-antitoxin system MqsA family antitoxin [Pseudomonas cyclaminis]MBE8598392.1 type II toxin-antitoxin system MqsA family antitoxin [Pseudomonas cyclaminis]VVN22333.1 Antitoxin MqsA [Pseudomonas fluorescens]